MVPGGITERVSYFMGYIHLVDETARAREAYDGSYDPARLSDYDPEQPNYVVTPDVLELASLPIASALLGTPPLTFDEFAVETSLFSEPTLPKFSFSLPAA